MLAPLLKLRHQHVDCHLYAALGDKPGQMEMVSVPEAVCQNRER
jgi:hypothetical protein